PEDLEIAGRRINTAINLAFEAYPQIRSTENFQDLQAQLEGTENRINVARQRYNEAVSNYNSYVRGFFKKMALNMFGGGEDFSPRQQFNASAAAQDAPTVNFDEDLTLRLQFVEAQANAGVFFVLGQFIQRSIADVVKLFRPC